MSTGIRYQILAELHVLHHYFLNSGTQDFEGMNSIERKEMINKYSVNAFFSIIPTTLTQQILKGLNIIFKNTPQGFVLLCRTDPLDKEKAWSDLQGNTPLCFRMVLKDSRFLNFSSLTLRQGNGKIYYFSNAGKENFQYPSLTNVAPEFDNNAANNASSDGDTNTFAYYPGDILVDDSTSPASVYHAIRSTNNGTDTSSDWLVDSPAQVYRNNRTYEAGDTVSYTVSGQSALYEALIETRRRRPTNTTNWKKIRNLPLNYVTVEDSISIISKVFNFSFLNSGIDANFEVKDNNGVTVITDSFTSNESQLSYQVDLRSLKDGLYSIKVIDNSGPLDLLHHKYYLMQNLQDVGNVFGVIELFLGNNSGSYSLVDTNNKINSHTYEVRFKNRSTVWRYKNMKGETEYMSQSNPLTQFGFINETYNENDLPNPDAGIIKPESDQYYSEIYIKTTN